MSLTSRQAWIVYAKLSLTMILWGIAWPIGRLLATGLPPVSVAVIRYTIVVPVFFLILWIREGSTKISKEWVSTFIGLGILNTSLYQL